MNFNTAIFFVLETGVHFLPAIDLHRIIGIRFCVLWLNEIIWYFLWFLSIFPMAKYFSLKNNWEFVAPKLYIWRKFVQIQKQKQNTCVLLFTVYQLKEFAFYELSYTVAQWPWVNCALLQQILSKLLLITPNGSGDDYGPGWEVERLKPWRGRKLLSL